MEKINHSMNKKLKKLKYKEKDFSGFQTSSFKPMLLLLGLILLTFIIYLKAINYEFIYNWDDSGYILKNENIKSLDIKSIIKHFTSFQMHNYHPLTTLSYSFEYALVGENPWLYHLTNILLHCINTLLVYLLFLKIFKNKFLPSLIVSAFFALHPMHVESVAWISERKDVLYTLFYLLALILYIKYIEQKRLKHILITFIFFVLSCLSKSAAVTLPVLLLAFDWYYQRKVNLNFFIEKIPFFLLSMLFGILAIYSQDTAIQNLRPMLTYFERFLIVCWAFCLYLYKLIFPINLSAFYPYPIKIDGVLPWFYYLSPIIVFAIFALIFYSRRFGRDIIFGFSFFLITISVILQILPVGGAIIAERYTYIPYLGLFFIVVQSFFKYDNSAVSKQKKQILHLGLFLCGIFLIWFTYLTNERIKYWRNGDILFSDVLKKYPLFPYGYNNRGFLYFDYYALQVYKDNEPIKQKYVEKAYKDYSKAIELDPSYVGAYINRAVLLYNTGRPEIALEDFNKALKLDYTNKDGLLGRANTLSTLNRYSEALPDYNKYINIYGADWKIYLWRGIAFSKTQQHNLALEDFLKANKIKPDDYESYLWLGITYFYLREYNYSIDNLTKGIVFNETKYDLYIWRGMAYHNIKQFINAINDFNKAIELNPSELSSYYHRSQAFNEIGMYKEALADIVYVAERGMPINKDYYFSLLQKIR